MRTLEQVVAVIPGEGTTGRCGILIRGRVAPVRLVVGPCRFWRGCMPAAPGASCGP